MSQLILVRHARSEWNAQGVWTGIRDVGLAAEAPAEIEALAGEMHDLTIDIAFSSTLTRAKETLRLLQARLGIELPTFENAALNERDYGIYTARNKWEVRDEIGEEAFFKLRRSWDFPVPGGESLKDVYARIVPFYENVLLEKLQEGQNVLVVAHGNSLRALMKHLDRVADDEVAGITIKVAEACLYDIDAEGRVLSKEAREREGSVAH